MTKRKRWTKEEDEILVQSIKDNPQNRMQAFKEVAAKTGRTEKSVSGRWYSVLSNPENKNYVGCMFTLIGHASRLDNRVINTGNSTIAPVKNKIGIWNKIKAILGLK